MSNSSINPALAGKSPLPETPGAEHTGQPVTSQFKGERVSLLPTPQSILADAMEEMTFSFSEVSQKKEISERNLRSGVKSFAMEQAQKYMEKVPDLDQDGALKKWVEELKQMPQSASPKALMQRAQERFKDPSHAFLALSLALDLFEHENPDSELAVNAKQAKELFYEQHAEAIDAGINISLEASNVKHAGLGNPQQLRAAYRDVVLDYGSIGTAYERIIAEFPGKPLPQAISFLMASLSADIHASQRDSSRSVKLQGIVNDLYQVKQLNTMYKSCENLLQRCHDRYASKPPADHGLVDRMLAFVIELKDAEWQGSRVIDKALNYTGLEEREANIYFLQGFKEIARLIPIKVFSDNNQRERMLESVQQRIDAEIDLEEAELE